MSTSKRFLGITVLSPFFQYEGIEPVLANVIERAGATAVACNTSVTAPGAEGEGSYQPPIDAGASVRLFDRPLWGKQALWLRSGPGHRANLDYFADSPYQPREPNDLTESEGPVIGRFIAAAKQAGLQVYIQTGATQPPGLREEDLPRLPDGRLPEARMAHTGSLASPAIRAYNRAWVRDIFAQYPQVDGIRPDWPEYPCYKLDEAFQDFGDHVAVWAAAHGFDFPRMREDVARFYRYLHGGGLNNADLAQFASPDRGKFALLQLFNRFPGVVEWLRCKAALSTDLLRDWHQAIRHFGGPEKELAANAFMPPFSHLTGLDFHAAGAFCASIAPKLYTMHWSLMVQFWGEVLLARNPGLDEALLVRALVNLMDLADGEEGGTRLAHYGYPAPDEPHPIPNAPQVRKIHQVLHAAGGRTRIYALVHGYGPLEDFRRRLQLVADSPVDGVWINRYGYLSDAKLDAIGEIWS
ncbi:hypothetical protein FKZ61_020610 [Litorilinea aerophila]|uniref:Uncharacterized protein n=1 Tax=Litorilinea aerophila TaxID=1204385 RepID=A0A540VA37_9CHLR|nr:hypothetical protein [Litorilinea aerophila]MCC9078506.1 hypothetical protein [Litorilinea aerophila]OUC06341.1 hypothetical protein RY27_21680 [Litorilinea aerophila]